MPSLCNRTGFYSVFIAGALVFALAAPMLAQDNGKRTALKAVSRRTTGDSELARLRAEVIEKMKESRASAEKLLAIHEDQVKALKDAYEQRRELYQQGLIS